jgi:hypothetical protein
MVSTACKRMASRCLVSTRRRLQEKGRSNDALRRKLHPSSHAGTSHHGGAGTPAATPSLSRSSYGPSSLQPASQVHPSAHAQFATGGAVPGGDRGGSPSRAGSVVSSASAPGAARMRHIHVHMHEAHGDAGRGGASAEGSRASIAGSALHDALPSRY